jgi:hypothetical protein
MSRAVKGMAVDPHQPMSPTAITVVVCPVGLKGGAIGGGGTGIESGAPVGGVLAEVEGSGDGVVGTRTG